MKTQSLDDDVYSRKSKHQASQVVWCYIITMFYIWPTKPRVQTARTQVPKQAGYYNRILYVTSCTFSHLSFTSSTDDVPAIRGQGQSCHAFSVSILYRVHQLTGLREECPYFTIIPSWNSEYTYLFGCLFIPYGKITHNTTIGVAWN